MKNQGELISRALTYFGVNDIAAVEEQLSGEAENVFGLIDRLPTGRYVTATQISVQWSDVLQVSITNADPLVVILHPFHSNRSQFHYSIHKFNQLKKNNNK